jgi:hypothetical protein
MEYDLKWKTTSNGRRPQMEDDLKWKTASKYLKWYIATTPYWIILNSRLNLRWPNHFFVILKMKTTFKRHNLKILKVEYFSNHLLDHTQILNLSSDDQSIFSKWRQTLMEDNLKILKVEYISEGNYSKTQRISRVWLCSAQLVFFFYWPEFWKKPFRHEILYTSSLGQNLQFTGFRKFFDNLNLIRVTFYVINALYFAEKATWGLKQCIFVEILQEIGFYTLRFMNFTFSSTIWDKSSAHALVKNSMSKPLGPETDP